MMNGAAFLALGVLFCVFGVGCSSASSAGRAEPSPDPFSGFFAHPGGAMLQLHHDGSDSKYRGSMWSDFGPFPVEVTRVGDLARGTVTYGAASHPLLVQSTPDGLVLTVDGTRADAPLQRYKDMKSYEKWLAAQGGYRAAIESTTLPSR